MTERTHRSSKKEPLEYRPLASLPEKELAALTVKSDHVIIVACKAHKDHACATNGGGVGWTNQTNHTHTIVFRESPFDETEITLAAGKTEHRPVKRGCRPGVYSYRIDCKKGSLDPDVIIEH